MEKGFTSHYTLVCKKPVSPDVCRTEDDFAKVRGLTSFFPIVKGEEIQGDEIVVFESAQVLPKYIVHYSVVLLLLSFCECTKLILQSSNKIENPTATTTTTTTTTTQYPQTQL